MSDRYGTLKDDREMTLEEVGKVLGVHPSRVAQLEKSALAKLRRNPKMRELLKRYMERRSGRVGTE